MNVQGYIQKLKNELYGRYPWVGVRRLALMWTFLSKVFLS